MAVALASLALAPRPGRAEPARPPALAWVPPVRARVWRAGEAAPVDVDPAADVALGPDDVLLVPASVGERFSVRGDFAEAGLGSGQDEAPDVVTWLPRDAGRAAGGDEVALPAWSSARFVVVRGAGRPVRVLFASTQSDTMRWHRFDAAVVDYVRRGRALPEAPSAEASALAREVGAWREALADAPPRARDSLLVARWLDESYRFRPLGGPFFSSWPVEPAGGAAEPSLPPPDPRAPPYRTFGAGQRVALDDGDADVLRVALRARGAARLIVREGDAVARVVRVPGPAGGGAPGWSPAEWVRVVLPAGRRRASIEVLEGTVALTALAYRHRPEFADWLPADKRREAALERAEAAEGEGAGAAAVRAAARWRRLASDEARQALASRAKATPADRALLRAALGSELAAASVAPDVAPPQVPAALDALAAARSPRARPLARALLRRLLEATPPGAVGAVPAALLAPAPGADPDDARVVAAYAAALAPPADGARPDRAAAEDAYARAHGDDADASNRARLVWSREGPWRSLDPAPGSAGRAESRVVTPDDGAGGLCAVVGPHGLRWTLLAGGAAKLAVAAPEGTHAQLLVRALEPKAGPDPVVRVDGVPVPVHGSAGLASLVAVRPGDHTFDASAAGAPLLVRAPRPGRVACSTLREIERWAPAAAGVTFAAPPGAGPAVARLAVSAESIGAGPRWQTLSIAAGRGAPGRAWVRRPASGAVDLSLAPGATELRVQGPPGLLVRASTRLHPEAPLATAARGRPADEAVIAPLLRELRDVTRELRARGDDPALVSRRASALERLGFRRLAASVRGVPPPDAAPPDDGATAPVAETVALPPDAPAVVPLGIAARVPALKPPDNPARLERARRAYEGGDMPATLAALGPARGARGGPELLLASRAAERTGDARQAAEAYEQLGRLTGAGAPLLRASSLWADVAAEANDPVLTLRAYALAQAGADAGEPADDVLGRFESAVRWTTPPRADSGATAVSVVSPPGTERPREGAPTPLGARVRRALADAPDDALVFGEGERAEVRTAFARPAVLELEASCEPLDGAPGACAARATLDLVDVPCPPARDRAKPCRVEIPPGKHRIDIQAPPERPSVSWARLREAGGSAPLPARVAARWAELDPGHPFELTVAGPTVVRVRGRADAGSGRTLRVDVVPSGRAAAPGGARSAELALAPTPDPSALRTAPDGTTAGPLGAEAEQRLALPEKGVYLVRVASPQGRAFVRADVATAVSGPRPRAAPTAPAPAGGGDRAASAGPLGPPVGTDPGRAFASLNATLSYVAADFASVVDAGARPRGTSATGAYLQLAVGVARELSRDLAWFSLSPFARLRSGPESFGARAAFDLAGEGARPYLYAHATAATQPDRGRTETGGHATVAAFWSVPLGTGVTLAPWLSYTEAVVARRAAALGTAADKDVYAPYNADTPRRGEVALWGVGRPWVDVQVTTSISARSTETFDAVDRVEASADVGSLAGAGLAPWVGVSWLGSARLPVDERREAFVRQVLGGRISFWSWVARGNRLTLGASGNFIFDLPRDAGGPPGASATAFLSYDFTGPNGLRDYPVRPIFYRSRLEEGSGLVQRREVSGNAWGY